MRLMGLRGTLVLVAAVASLTTARAASPTDPSTRDLSLGVGIPSLTDLHAGRPQPAPDPKGGAVDSPAAAEPAPLPAGAVPHSDLPDDGPRQLPRPPRAPEPPFEAHLRSRGVKRVLVVNAGGDVHVHGVADRIDVRAVRTLGDARCRVQVSQKRGVVTLRTTRVAGKMGCRFDLDLALPSSVAARLEVKEGDVTLTGWNAKLAVRLGHGNAVVNGVFPRLDVQIEQGSVSAQGTFEKVSLRLERGNAQLWYGKGPRKSAVWLAVGQGNVCVTAPTARAQVHASLGRGTLQNDLDAQARDVIVVDGSVGVGDLLLRRVGDGL